MGSYKYDIALSFLKDDESLAKQIAEKIAESYSVFIYSERQQELAGTDGEVSFRNVFTKESRFVLVLYRPGWGETEWTRVEEEAIRERTRTDGYDFFKLLMLESSYSSPKWVPKHQIWISYERFGFDSVITILDSRLQEAGAEPQIETPQLIASRIKKRQDFEKEREELRSNQIAVDLFRNSFEILCKLIQLQLDDVKKANPRMDISFKLEGTTIRLDYGPYNASVYFENQFSNVLGDQSGIRLLFGKRPSIMDFDSYGRGPRKLSEIAFVFDYLKDKEWYWCTNKRNKCFTNMSLSEFVVKELLILIEKSG